MRSGGGSSRRSEGRKRETGPSFASRSREPRRQEVLRENAELPQDAVRRFYQLPLAAPEQPVLEPLVLAHLRSIRPVEVR